MTYVYVIYANMSAHAPLLLIIIVVVVVVVVVIIIIIIIMYMHRIIRFWLASYSDHMHFS